MTACNLQFAAKILNDEEFEQFKDYYYDLREHTSNSAFRLACMYAESYDSNDFLRRNYKKRSEMYMNYALLIEKLEETVVTEAIKTTFHSSLPVSESCYDPFQNRNDPKI